jgi:hypothetical protein
MREVKLGLKPSCNALVISELAPVVNLPQKVESEIRLFKSLHHNRLNLTRFDGHPDNARCYARAGRCSWQNQKENSPLSSS